MRANEDFRSGDFSSWLVYADAGLAVVNKPAGVLSQPGPPGEPDLVTMGRAHFGDEGLGVLHRLDRNVSGLVLISRSAEVARWLTRQFSEGRVERDYVAICRGRADSDRFVMEEPLLKDERTNTVRVAVADEVGAQQARTEVEVLERLQGLVGRLVRLRARPLSGRSHQLRVHLAHHGLPILGDPKYGVLARGLSRPLLHAFRVSFLDERSGERRQFEAAPPFSRDEVVLLRSRAR